MLRYLAISDLAVIESVSVDFEHSFNVLTGETGAGKSMWSEPSASCSAAEPRRNSCAPARTSRRSRRIFETAERRRDDGPPRGDGARAQPRLRQWRSSPPRRRSVPMVARAGRIARPARTPAAARSDTHLPLLDHWAGLEEADRGAGARGRACDRGPKQPRARGHGRWGDAPPGSSSVEFHLGELAQGEARRG